MLMLLSPAKNLNINPISLPSEAHKPRALVETTALVNLLKTYTPVQLQKLMSVSPKLAELNYQRFQNFNPKVFNQDNAKPAIYAFEGDVYRYLDANHLSSKQIAYLQNHLLILSGLYGILQPLDLIQPYRLEMGSSLKIPGFKNLYDFWQNLIIEEINNSIKTQHHQEIINLASDEYFKAVVSEQLTAPVIKISFKEKRGDTYRTISLNAKRARGMMARYITVNELSHSEELKSFNVENYRYAEYLSDESHLCFVR